MKVELMNIYDCEFCNKYYKRKHFAEKHEKSCNLNPDNWRACHSCSHLTKKDTEIYSGVDDYYTCEPEDIKRSFLFCKEKNIFLYPPKSEHKDNHNHVNIDGGSFENYPMPKACELSMFDLNEG